MIVIVIVTTTTTKYVITIIIIIKEITINLTLTQIITDPTTITIKIKSII